MRKKNLNTKLFSKKWAERKRRTRANVASDGSGNDEYSGADGSADAEENEVEQAESAEEAIASRGCTDGGFW